MENGRTSDLRDRLGFEIEVLRIIADQTQVVDGSVDPTLIELVNRRKGAKIGAKVHINVSDTVGSGTAKTVLDAICALALLSCFKILDVVVEWILGLNAVPVKGSGTGYRFTQKTKDIRTESLELPAILSERAWLWDRALGLYLGLVPFRHEVVHRHSYAVEDDVLTIKDSSCENRVLQLGRHELGSLARFVVGLGLALAEEKPLDLHLEMLMKYYADQTSRIHGGESFEQKEPLRLRVSLTVPEEEGTFVANVSQVRREVTRIHSERDVLFDLDVAAVRDDEAIWEWSIPYDQVPAEELLELTADTLPQYRRRSQT